MRTVILGMLVASCAHPETPAPSTPSGPPQVPATSDAAAPLPPEAVPLGRLPADVHPEREALALDIDPDAERFGGTAEIAVRLDRPRDVIWLHGRGLAVSSATVEAAGTKLAASWSEADPSGVAKLALPRPVSGSVILRIAYDAAYDTQLVGVYRTGHAVFSKFEAIYARRAFPGFDEPAFKIPFDITLRVPAANVVLGNMPIAEEVNEGARRRVRFETTPPLPTYLVAFAVGPFERRASSVPAGALRSTPLPTSVVTMRGRAADGAFAVAAAVPLIAEEERYFGIAFPYPKLDLVAIPDFQSGAMENAGAITFRDSLLLVDDKVTSFANKVRVVEIIAHELAHQWFGDLVTMTWWEDLWLNEGFATFLEQRIVRTIRPELEVELSALDSTNRVMNLDSLASARRIRQPIASTHDITNAFDDITYEKGAAFLAMLEHYVGDERFRSGVHAYLTAHATGNATTDELIAALSKAAGSDLAPLAASFLDQPGVPNVAVRVACEGGRGRVELAQSRWRPIGAVVADAAWTVPVCIRAEVGGVVGESCTLLRAPTGAIELPSCPAWVMPNAGATGYYRFALAAPDLTHLRDRAMPKLAIVERLALAHNLEAALRSGALPGGDVLRALEPLARDPHGAVASAPLETFERAYQSIVDPALRPRLARHVAQLYAPTVRALGWKPLPSEPAARRNLRTKLLGLLALRFDDPATLDEAARLGRRYLGLDRDGVPHPDAVDPDLLDLALIAVVRRGDAAVFDAILARLVASTDSQMRVRYLAALASVRTPALVERALGLALDPRLRANERGIPLYVPLDGLDTRDQAWTWLVAHFDELAKLLPDRLAQRIPGMYRVCDAKRAEDLRAFFTPRADAYTGMPRALAQDLEAAAQCAARADAQRASIDTYVKALR